MCCYVWYKTRCWPTLSVHPAAPMHCIHQQNAPARQSCVDCELVLSGNDSEQTKHYANKMFTGATTSGK